MITIIALFLGDHFVYKICPGKPEITQFLDILALSLPLLTDMLQHTNIHNAFANYFTKDKLHPFLYHLSKKMSEGNVCLALDSMTTEEWENEAPDPQVVQQHVLVGNADEVKPFILFQDRLYLHRFYHYEKQFVQKILVLVRAEVVPERMDFLRTLRPFIQEQLFAPEAGLQSTNWQMVACLNAFLHQFSIISGGPGTGKTTTVTKLLSLFLYENRECRIMLCAPTGKAKVRLEEGLRKVRTAFHAIEIEESIIARIEQLQTSTIHSLLGYIPDSIHFKHNEHNPLEADVLIVDECSMIDMALFHKLFKAIDPLKTKVILLGDQNQLASVDAGSVFSDLCAETTLINQFDAARAGFLNEFLDHEAHRIQPESISTPHAHPLFQHIVALQLSYRFDDDKGIGKLSKAILHNDVAAINSFFEAPDEVVALHKHSALPQCVQDFSQKLLATQGGYIGIPDISEALARMTNSTILCVVKEGRQGVYALNEQVARNLFNPEAVFYENQLIMVSQNQPQEGIFNGDMALIRSSASDGLYYAYLPKSEQEYMTITPPQIQSWEPAYAMTIHKSQGSEFNEVLIVLPEAKEHQLLTRELLYTAITRAKRKVVIVGDKDTILATAAQSIRRISGIQQQFLILQ
ncbi:exodeoxyribonuclease V subunit alpha [Taibaiella sp. KBW10]|uniref:exodeoxyribonuclease V subunit alpha n=1 Tax=Taibaiella sp. KBW10 TaxID=2153357 RepID=UPI000F5A7E48|nr:exodeoxyribonuclease V subunit alpha [Taibaiella sp. KBW10]RQO31651.1 exodeoxyribonuclease V subunit alpha [Taibaiella sp. KBW10]